MHPPRSLTCTVVSFPSICIRALSFSIEFWQLHKMHGEAVCCLFFGLNQEPSGVVLVHVRQFYESIRDCNQMSLACTACVRAPAGRAYCSICSKSTRTCILTSPFPCQEQLRENMPESTWMKLGGYKMV